MPKPRVRPRADQFVIFFDRDAGAPILSQMPARPQCQSDSGPREPNADHAQSESTRNESMPENPDLRLIAKEQNEAGNLNEENAVARSERLRPLRSPGLERAHRPIDNKDDPRALDEIFLGHFSATLSEDFHRHSMFIRHMSGAIAQAKLLGNTSSGPGLRNPLFFENLSLMIS
jgi:hypothetical protein